MANSRWGKYDIGFDVVRPGARAAWTLGEQRAYIENVCAEEEERMHEAMAGMHFDPTTFPQYFHGESATDAWAAYHRYCDNLMAWATLYNERGGVTRAQAEYLRALTVSYLPFLFGDAFNASIPELRAMFGRLFYTFQVRAARRQGKSYLFAVTLACAYAALQTVGARRDTLYIVNTKATAKLTADSFAKVLTRLLPPDRYEISNGGLRVTIAYPGDPLPATIVFRGNDDDHSERGQGATYAVLFIDEGGALSVLKLNGLYPIGKELPIAMIYATSPIPRANPSVFDIEATAAVDRHKTGPPVVVIMNPYCRMCDEQRADYCPHVFDPPPWLDNEPRGSSAENYALHATTTGALLTADDISRILAPSRPPGRAVHDGVFVGMDLGGGRSGTAAVALCVTQQGLVIRGLLFTLDVREQEQHWAQFCRLLATRPGATGSTHVLIERNYPIYPGFIDATAAQSRGIGAPVYMRAPGSVATGFYTTPASRRWMLDMILMLARGGQLAMAPDAVVAVCERHGLLAADEAAVRARDLFVAHMMHVGGTQERPRFKRGGNDDLFLALGMAIAAACIWAFSRDSPAHAPWPVLDGVVGISQLAAKMEGAIVAYRGA